MPPTKTRLATILDRLEKAYGPPAPPPVTSPLEVIYWENVGNSVDDERRAAAFAALKKKTGLNPKKIVAAKDEALLDIAKLGGMKPEDRTAKWREIAELALEAAPPNGDLNQLFELPLAEVRQVLKKFPGIGAPGIEKVLLLAGKELALALESHAVRTLNRLGFGRESTTYAKSLKSAQDAACKELDAASKVYLRAGALLRRLGQERCHRNNPECSKCIVNSECAFYSAEE